MKYNFQLLTGKGSDVRRLIWWPRFRHLAVRYWRNNWLNFHWYPKL